MAANKQNIFGAFVRFRHTASLSPQALQRLRAGGYAAVSVGALLFVVAPGAWWAERRNATRPAGAGDSVGSAQS